MDANEALVYAAALDTLRRLDPSTLPTVATEAVLQGLESEALFVLAGESPTSDPHDLRERFAAALDELGIPQPSRLEAATTIKRRIAADVVAGRVGRREGAAEIVGLALDVEDETPNGPIAGSGFGIAELLGLYYGYDDIGPVARPDDAAYVAELEAGILDACKRIVAGEDG